MTVDAPSRANALYDQDFFAWTQEQARLLRERRFDDLDLENLIDEVESVGSTEKREIRSRLKVLVAHLLKWKFQPGRRSESWRKTLREQREQVTEIMEASPSLRAYVTESMSRCYIGAVLAASDETGIVISVFPRTSPFTPEQVLDSDFLPEDPSSE